jgi:hypothetical protein
LLKRLGHFVTYGLNFVALWGWSRDLGHWCTLVCASWYV